MEMRQEPQVQSQCYQNRYDGKKVATPSFPFNEQRSASDVRAVADLVIRHLGTCMHWS